MGRKIAVCMKFKQTRGSRMYGRSSGTRSDNQIERKVLHMYMEFFRDLLYLKALLVIGFTVFALYVEVGEGCHRL